MKKTVKKTSKKDTSSQFVLTAVVLFIVLLAFVLVVSKMSKNETQVTRSQASEYGLVSEYDDPVTLQAETDKYIQDTETLLLE